MRQRRRALGAVACTAVWLASGPAAWPQPTGAGSAVLVASFDVEAPAGGHAWLGEGASMLLEPPPFFHKSQFRSLRTWSCGTKSMISWQCSE